MRPIKIPPRIQWQIKGDGVITETEQKLMIAEAQRQMDTLLRDMKFQGLVQGRRIQSINSYIYRCTSVAGLNKVNIFMHAPGPEKKKPILILICFCGAQVAEGIITRIILPNNPSEHIELCIPFTTERYVVYYPENVYSPRPYNYGGIRYEVNVCQRPTVEDSLYICIPTDYETYEMDDKVAIMDIGSLPIHEPPITGAACEIERDNYPGWPILDPYFGRLVILPYTILKDKG